MRDERTGDWRHISDALDNLAYRVSYLRPDYRNPERFHEEKSEIEHELRSLHRVLSRPNVYGSA